MDCPGAPGPAATLTMLPPLALLDAYRTGWFPMGERGASTIQWFSPDPRGVLPLDAFHVPARLERVRRRAVFDVRVDSAFAAVVRACAERRDTWISDTIFRSYATLHMLGHAHSVECWRDGRLVGGLYGVALGGAFFGESMFHTETDASKVALCALVDRLRSREFALLDIQWVTPHLRQFGAIEVRRADNLRRLAAALDLDRQFT
jgi:leucyl/phenylalanyl-tRNA---protein transferase